MTNKLKVLVLAGGNSEERDVSLASAKAITESLFRVGYDVSVIDSGTGKSLIDGGGKYILEKDEGSDSRIALRDSPNLTLAESLALKPYRDVDLVFLALHGGAGEDGTIQALLNLAGKRYSGSGVMASAIAMNKAFAKKIVRNEGIPTPAWELLRIESEDDIKKGLEILSNHPILKPPIIIKPNDSGSTIGLTLVRNKSEIESALKEAYGVSRNILAEEYIKGREITASVLNSTSLPLVEIIPTNDLYDYQCKYTKGKSRYICPAEIKESVTLKIQEYARKAFETIGCSGLARADFILKDNSDPYFLEINTLPGMTELSLAPMAARTAGIDFDHLIRIICESALKS